MDGYLAQLPEMIMTAQSSQPLDVQSALEDAVNDATKLAISHYISATPGNDREALARLQNQVSNILLNAAKVPDALKTTLDQHSTNQDAQAKAQTSAPKDQPSPSKPK